MRVFRDLSDLARATACMKTSNTGLFHKPVTFVGVHGRFRFRLETLTVYADHSPL
jgi:hypothetical protein